jgi:ABC-type transport system substrate-binding protein
MAIQQGNSQHNYEYQPVMQDGFSTFDSGLATNETVPVALGDTVYNADGEPEELAAGTRVIVDGQITEYDGTSPLELPQLTVTYRLKPYTWSDGTPGSVADVQLAYQINCDPESGATSFITCESMANVEYAEGDAIEWTVTYLPGVLDPYYYVAPFTISPKATIYPSHQVLSDGRRLAEVPAAEWVTLPEIAEMPLSAGPFMITEWIKGQSITLEANPYFEGGTGVQSIVVVIVPDTNQAVAQLLAGDIDYLESATLGAGAEVQTVVDAAAEGQVNVEIKASPTWEHIDMNLYVE